MPSSRLAFIALGCLLALAAGAYALTSRDDAGHARACPPGYVSQAERDRLERRERAAGGEAEAEAEEEEREAGPKPPAGACYTRKHPEPKGELLARDRQSAGRVTAPASALKPGAYAAAARRARRMGARASSLPGAGEAWEPAGKGPLINDDERYDEVNGLGLADVEGRVSDFAHDPASGRLYAAVGEGGVWESSDRGASWRSIADNLTTQAVGSVAVSGGTVLALTGDSVFGGGATYAGAGLYRTTDRGATWQKASGLPEGVIAFKVAVDPTDPSEVYAATGAGLFRSTDTGATFANVDLPTGGPASCTGAPPDKEGCFLANMVTDVAIQRTTGEVVAAVGWRAGNKQSPPSKSFPSGYPEGPNNGIYRSADGTPGSFDKTGTGFTPQDQIGRIELGAADGPDQDHDYLYAIVEDAGRFNGGVQAIDADPGVALGVSRTTLDGIYVSGDFGATWTKMTDADILANDPTTGSALTGTACAQLYCPGVQAWYNAWIKPDPTRQDANGVPTRLAFGLEEVWQSRRDEPQNYGLAQAPGAFEVVGPYFGGETCLFLDTGQPDCPTAGDPATPQPTTTHPDQHAAVFLPGENGSVTFVVGHDGGVNTQTAAAGEQFREDRWGRGGNGGFNTLLPYDAQIAKDGTIWSGLQDNGEMKIEPNGKQVATYGGDGGFSAVDPSNSEVAYEEYVYADMRSTTNGGQSWQSIAPPDDPGYQFINPFVMDPSDASHLLTAGKGVYETTSAPNAEWTKVYDLGTGPGPGNNVNKVSAVDLRGAFEGGVTTGPAGPKTADFNFGEEQETVPGADGSTQLELPGTYADRPFTIRPNESNARAIIQIEWPSRSDDWDMRVLKDGQVVGESLSAGGSGTTEKITLTAPKPGDYVIRVYNYAATGTFSGTARFEQAVGTDITGDGAAAYVGFCGYCDALNNRPFGRGLATNVGGDKPPKRLSPDGWHIARAEGLPNRYITSVQMDPADPRTVYVTVGGYSRRWLPVNKLGEDTPNVGTGHVFKSTDAGQTFRNVSGSLPDAPANWTVVRDGRLIAGTDVGVFISSNTDGASYDVLGRGLPPAPVHTMELQPGDPNELIVATQGRGVYRYRFSASPGGTGLPQKASTRNPVACTASRGFRSATASGAGRRGLRFSFERREANPVQVDLFRVSRGRRVIDERLVARFTRRSRSFTWSARRGRGGRPLGDGIYFARYRIAYGNRLRDFRRVTLQRSKGRWSRRPLFYRAESCELLGSFKLERPVFGGTRRRQLGIAYRITRPSRVTLEVFRGSRRVRSFLTRSRLPGRTYRHTLAARGLGRGDYRVRISVRSGNARAVSALVSRRL